MRRLQSDTIAVDIAGAGAPMALLHGVGADRGIWREVTRRMRDERRLIVPDLPGFGESAPLGSGFDLAKTADALAQALGDRVSEPFDLVGNSLGGAVAVALALRHPSLVRRLVLVAPAGFSPLPRLVSEPIARVAPIALTGRRVLGTPLVASGAARRLLLWGTVAAPGRLSGRDARLMLQSSRHSSRVGSAVGAVLRADLLSELADLQPPLGLLWGERDRVIPIRTMRALHAACPTAETEIISDAGHVPQLERPDEFVGALARLLARL